jgi:hypothetical protein
MKYLEDLLHWVTERENIRKDKEVGRPPPWTADYIMAGNRWCNVRREDDKVTRWIFEHFMPKDLSDPTIPFAMCVARLVNWPDTLKELGYPTDGWNAEYQVKWLETFARIRAEKGKAWTGAYMVTGGFSAGGEPKEVIISRVLDGAWEQCRRFSMSGASTLADAAKRFSTPGMGTFLIAQVIADLKNTQWLDQADDWWTWCAPGPGSQMGLNFLHERARGGQWTGADFIVKVNEVRQIISKETGIHLCAQNTQNCLCEFSKYVRARHFGERLKNTYSTVR